MKKLSLKPNAFNKGEILTKTQLKKVLGGYVGSASPGCNTAPCNWRFNGQSEIGDCISYPVINGSVMSYLCYCRTASNTNPATSGPSESCRLS